MDDVERICHVNNERRKWADEYAAYTDFGQAEIATVSAKPRNDRGTDCHGLRPRNDRKRRVLRTACTACMMACGGGAAFVGIGISMGHWLTVTVGTLVATAFLLTGTKLEDALEERP